MVANAPTTDGLGKRYGTFSGWGMAARKVEVVIHRLDVDRGAEARLVNKYVSIQEGDMRRGDGPSTLDWVASIEVLKEKGIMTMSPQQEYNHQ